MLNEYHKDKIKHVWIIEVFKEIKVGIKEKN